MISGKIHILGEAFSVHDFCDAGDPGSDEIDNPSRSF